MQTVREQLAEALEATRDEIHRYRHPYTMPRIICGIEPCGQANRALDRHRAEPECTAPTGQPTEVHCTDCGCYEAGHQAGLEAQRERA